MMTQEQFPLRIEGLDEYQTKLIESSPAWLKATRQRSVGQLSHLGIPSMKDEEFKYTSFVELNKKFQLATSHRFIEQEQLGTIIDAGEITVVLVNGLISAELSKLSD